MRDKESMVYIAGPMRGQKWFNFPAFDAAKNTLEAQGWTVVSPADIDRHFGFDAMALPEDYDWNVLPDSLDYEEIMTRDLKAMEDCSAIVLLEGWTESKGAGRELVFAIEHGMDVYRIEEFALPPQCLPARCNTSVSVRAFATGATRSADSHKFDYEGFLDPECLYAYAEYMHKHRKQADGTLRSSDNWQKGMSKDVYMKSMLRHTMDLWRLHRGHAVLDPDSMEKATAKDLCCAILFNVFGYLREGMVEDELRVIY